MKANRQKKKCLICSVVSNYFPADFLISIALTQRCFRFWSDNFEHPARSVAEMAALNAIESRHLALICEVEIASHDAESPDETMLESLEASADTETAASHLDRFDASVTSLQGVESLDFIANDMFTESEQAEESAGLAISLQSFGSFLDIASFIADTSASDFTRRTQ